MELSDNFHTDLTARKPLDASIMVTACASLVTALVMATLTCVCCNRKEKSNNNTVPLEDLQSKPSLVDPESIMSEACSEDFEQFGHTVSSMRGTGEGSSMTCESVSQTGINMSEGCSENTGAVLLNFTPYVSDKWSMQSIKRVSCQQSDKLEKQAQQSDKLEKQAQQSDKLEKQAQQLSQQRHSFSGKCPNQSAFHNKEEFVDNGPNGDDFIHELSRSPQVAAGSRKSYNHIDISGKVRVDSAALKIHRDSVTREGLPFLHSARCSFSHEVGHIVHGTKVPRTSLPTTEEQADSSNRRSSILSTEEIKGGQTEMSHETHKQGTQTRCPGTITTSYSEQKIDPSLPVYAYKVAACQDPRPADLHTEDELQRPDVHSESRILNRLRSHVRSDAAAGSSIEHGGEFQRERVPSRRCVSCIHGDVIYNDHVSTPRRKTFSLNLTIDVHLESLRGSDDNLSAVVCSPLIDYAQCDTCDTDSSRVDDHTAAVRCENNAARSRIVIEGRTVNGMTESTQVSGRVNADANKGLLEKSKEQYGSYNKHLIVQVHKRRSEPAIPANGDLEDCNIRYGNRHSESAAVAPPQLVHRQGHGPCTAVEHMPNCYKDETRQRGCPSGSHQVLPPRSNSFPTGRELTMTRTEKIVTSCDPAPDSLSVPANMMTTSQENITFTNTDLQIPVQQAEISISRAVQVGDFVDAFCGLVTTETNSCGVLTNMAQEIIPSTGLLTESGIDTTSKEKQCRCENHRSLGSCHKSSEQTTTSETVKDKVVSPISAHIATPATSREDTNSSTWDTTSNTFDQLAPCDDISPVQGHDVTPVSCHDVTPVSCHDVTPVSCHDVTPATRHDDTPVTRHDVTPAERHDVTSTDRVFHQKCTQENSRLLSTDPRRLKSSDVRNTVQEVATVKTPSDGKVSGVYECHKRAQSVNKRFGWTSAPTTGIDESRCMRATSLKAHSSVTRTQSTQSSQGHSQERRKAGLFFEDDIVHSQASVDPGNRPGCMNIRGNSGSELHLLNNNSSRKDDTLEAKIKLKKQLDDVSGDRASPKAASTQNIPASCLSSRRRPICGERKALDVTRGLDEDTTRIQVAVLGNSSEEEAITSGQKPGRSNVSFRDENCAVEIEPREVSDDSDYDNPWDDLDDAVKRASIRYNRRPSRIAAGDSKTLLLKSAEDLGRLLEEADKRRQLRQARNSCQVMSPECATESMTIPFTRHSPHRHTVKSIVPQPHLSVAHSTEDILKAHSPAYPKLSLLRQEKDQDAQVKGIDVRRPMSLASKVRGKVTSPQTKKRKK